MDLSAVLRAELERALGGIVGVSEHARGSSRKSLDPQCRERVGGRAARAREVYFAAFEVGREGRAELAGVVAGPVDQRGLPAPQELHAHEVQTWRVDHAAGVAHATPGG